MTALAEARFYAIGRAGYWSDPKIMKPCGLVTVWDTRQYAWEDVNHFLATHETTIPSDCYPPMERFVYSACASGDCDRMYSEVTKERRKLARERRKRQRPA